MYTTNKLYIMYTTNKLYLCIPPNYIYSCFAKRLSIFHRLPLAHLLQIHLRPLLALLVLILHPTSVVLNKRMMVLLQGLMPPNVLQVPRGLLFSLFSLPSVRSRVLAWLQVEPVVLAEEGSQQVVFN